MTKYERKPTLKLQTELEIGLLFNILITLLYKPKSCYDVSFLLYQQTKSGSL